MPQHDHRPDDQPERAVDEVLREIREAEHRVEDSERRRHRRGEAGEAITPNTQAQEESQGD
ncbi:hypothetical protein OG800_04660 [Streptomyces sp. NBC_00445]|uniref:hypothetical protein n=1 Tax=unclassified Streptomyces TaxID=2593676 RepID=UPI002E1EAD77|nr:MULTISPECIES: hypothetical protein [unclassified Streptomyces]